MATWDVPDPIVFNHSLRVGDTYQPTWVQLTVGGEVVTLEGASGTWSLRREAGGLVLADGEVLVNEVSNVFSWVAAHAATAALAEHAGEMARFALRLTFGDGTRRTVIVGDVELMPETI